MEACLNVLLDFPYADILDSEYESMSLAHSERLARMVQDQRSLLVTHAKNFLELLNPSINSASYLALIHMSLNTPANLPKVDIASQDLSCHLLRFLLTFEPRQVLYMGPIFSSILSSTLECTLLPARFAIRAVIKALLRLEPTGAIFTSSHAAVARLAYESGSHTEALPLLEKVITSSADGRAPQDDSRQPNYHAMAPQDLLYRAGGFSEPITATMCLEYYFFSGMIFCALRRWSESKAAFQRCISYPINARSTAISKIMVEAYKKWALISTIANGEASALPAFCKHYATYAFEVLCKPYSTVAKLFASPDPLEFLKEVGKHEAVWAEDRNESLILELKLAYQVWQIIKLRRVYECVSIREIRTQTWSALTGAQLTADAEVVDLVQTIIEHKVLQRAELEGTWPSAAAADDDAYVATYLRFLPDEAPMFELDFNRAATAKSSEIAELDAQLRAVDDRLTFTREYVRHLAREKKKRTDRDKDVAAASTAATTAAETHNVADFDAVEDEDLMAGLQHSL